MKVVMKAAGAIRPYEQNAKQHDQQQIDNVAESIRLYGFVQPLVVDREGVIIIGHCRYAAAVQLGMDKLPCVVASGLSEDEARALRLADNKLNESAWDWEALAGELEEAPDFGEMVLDWDLPDKDTVTVREHERARAGTGEAGEEEKTEEAELEEDELPPEPPAKPRARPGDIYQLGRHRLMCGDSTSAEDVARLMDGVAADLLLTDPPYNVNVGNCERPNSIHNGEKILNDNMGEEQFFQFLSSALRNGSNNMKAGAAFYVWYTSMKSIPFEMSIRRIEDFKFHEQLVWVKSRFILGRNTDYQWQHELCFYGWKTGALHYFTDSRAEGTVIEVGESKLSTLKKEELIALCEKLMGITKSSTILRAEKPNSAELHPTVKPQALLTPLILNSTRPGERVLDLFGGSGSTLIACEQTGRACFMMELDPRYVDVIIARWEKLTGEKAVMVEGAS